MSEYEIPEEKRASLELWVENILTLEGIRHLEVVKKPFLIESWTVCTATAGG